MGVTTAPHTHTYTHHAHMNEFPHPATPPQLNAHMHQLYNEVVRMLTHTHARAHEHSANRTASVCVCVGGCCMCACVCASFLGWRVSAVRAMPVETRRRVVLYGPTARIHTDRDTYSEIAIVRHAHESCAGRGCAIFHCVNQCASHANRKILCGASRKTVF